jgi:hypothetical protein
MIDRGGQPAFAEASQPSGESSVAQTLSATRRPLSISQPQMPAHPTLTEQAHDAVMSELLAGLRQPARLRLWRGDKLCPT